ncbi:MAG: bifunctional adenosylcobinamide kinase/adenosylcobinamide-phosphate guanylyltransferase [Pseudomonadota bacterium]
MATLILGGARSGKSRYAQTLAESSSTTRIFIATAEAFDEEMTNRIARHIADRGDSWATVEAPLNVSRAIRDSVSEDCVVVVDCLTLWLSNLMHAKLDVEHQVRELAETLKTSTTPLILVSNGARRNIRS